MTHTQSHDLGRCGLAYHGEEVDKKIGILSDNQVGIDGRLLEPLEGIRPLGGRREGEEREEKKRKRKRKRRKKRRKRKRRRTRRKKSEKENGVRRSSSPWHYTAQNIQYHYIHVYRVSYIREELEYSPPSHTSPSSLEI